MTKTIKEKNKTIQIHECKDHIPRNFVHEVILKNSHHFYKFQYDAFKNVMLVQPCKKQYVPCENTNTITCGTWCLLLLKICYL